MTSHRFPVPPLKKHFTDSIREEADQVYEKMKVPLDLFQAIFYTALGFSGAWRLFDLASKHQINLPLGYTAGAVLCLLSFWLTVRYAVFLGELVGLAVASCLSEKALNNKWVFAIATASIFALACTLDIVFIFHANCALLNDCPKPI